MGHATALISLSLLTLLTGLAIAAYQLWSANESQKKGNHSALAARYGGRPMSKAKMQPVAAPPASVRPTSMDEAAPALDTMPATMSETAAASRKKGSGRGPKGPTGTDQTLSPEDQPPQA